MAAITGALLLVGHHIWAVAVLLSLWGLLATAAPTGWWTWIARALPEDAETGGGLMVAVIQLLHLVQRLEVWYSTVWDGEVLLV